MRAKGTAFLIITTLAAIAVLMNWAKPVEAYEQWYENQANENCLGCHGDFQDDNYISPVDGQNWGNLHNIHRFDMLDDDCDVCHLDS